MELLSTLDTTNALISHIETKTPNLYFRFGDGDFNLMEGRGDMLAVPSSELQHAYQELWKRLSNKNMIGVMYHCKELGTLEAGMYPGVHECPEEYAKQCINRTIMKIPTLSKMYSHAALHHMLSTNTEKYREFLRAIKTNASTILLCNRDFSSSSLDLYFGKHIKIGASCRDSFFERDRIWSEFDSALQTVGDAFTVCILALGCGGRAMSYKLIDLIGSRSANVLLIDIGSSIDVLMGLRNTRAWVEYTNPDISSLL